MFQPRTTRPEDEDKIWGRNGKGFVHKDQALLDKMDRALDAAREANAGGSEEGKFTFKSWSKFGKHTVLAHYAKKKNHGFISHVPFNDWVNGDRDIPPNVKAVINMMHEEYVGKVE